MATTRASCSRTSCTKYEFVAPDPTGKYLLYGAGKSAIVVRNGWIDNGKIIPLNPGNGNQLSFEAW
jgi:hypothetical protein